jgi:ribosomal protein L13E
MVIAQELSKLGFTVDSRRDFEHMENLTGKDEYIAIEVEELSKQLKGDSFLRGLHK